MDLQGKDYVLNIWITLFRLFNVSVTQMKATFTIVSLKTPYKNKCISFLSGNMLLSVLIYFSTWDVRAILVVINIALNIENASWLMSTWGRYGSRLLLWELVKLSIHMM